MSFLSNWNSNLWRLLKPKSVVSAVATLCKSAYKPLIYLRQLEKTGSPVACGEDFKTVSIPLENIIREDNRYRVLGLPSGAVTIGKSPDGATALRYVDFSEVDSVYVFNSDPTNFGVVNTRNGAHCSFCITRGASVTLGYQDLENVFHGSLSDTVNKHIHEYMASRNAVNGLGGVVLALAQGCTPASRDSEGFIAWREGSDVYAEIDNAPVLASGCELSDVRNSVQAGECITNTNTRFVVLPSNDLGISWVDEDNLHTVSEIHEAFPKLVTDTLDTVAATAKLYGHVTLDTTKSFEDPGSQKLIRAHLSYPSGMHLTQLVEANCVLTDEEFDRLDTVALICSNTDSMPSATDTQSYIGYILNHSVCGYAVEMNRIQKVNNSFIYACTDESKAPINPLTAGTYIHAILLADSKKPVRRGCILRKIDIKPLVVKSGESAVIKIIRENS